MSSKNKSEKLLINLEIKSTPEEENLTPEPEDTVKLIMNDINETSLKDKIIVSSFDWRTLTVIKNNYPEIPRAYLTQHLTGININQTIYNLSLIHI